MKTERPNLKRDLAITEALLSGSTAAVISERLGISKSRVLQSAQKVMEDLTHPSRNAEAMPKHDFWILAQARQHAAFWIRRINARRKLMQAQSDAQ
jgi:DNA-binding NarL/FixJ family response regulator